MGEAGVEAPHALTVKTTRRPAKASKGAGYAPFSGLQLDDAPLEADHRGVRAVLRAELREDVAHLALDRFLGERELRGDFLVGVALRDEAQHAQLGRGQMLVGRI